MKRRVFCLLLSLLLVLCTACACRKSGGGEEDPPQTAETVGFDKSRDGSGRADGSFTFSEEAENALNSVRQAVLDAGCIAGVRALGGVDKSGGPVTQDTQYLTGLFASYGLDADWPFVVELPSSQMVETDLGQEMYVIVPVSDACTVSVNKWICNEENGYVGEPGEVLYRCETGTPILLVSNYSDVFPDVNVTVVGNGMTASFEPRLSLMDGSLTLPSDEPVTDLTPYEPETDGAGPDNIWDQLYGGQLEIIENSVGTWRVPENERENVPVYTVTDLDDNGRLELISTCSHGTGQYSTSKIYEITEDHNALVPCQYGPSTMSSEPELGTMSWAYYYDGSGSRAYIVNDFLREGYDLSHTYKYAMWFAGGEAWVKLLGYVDMYAGADENGELDLQYDYFDAEDRPITAMEYDDIADTFFNAPAPSFIQLYWFDPDDGEPLAQKLQLAVSTFYRSLPNG